MRFEIRSTEEIIRNHKIDCFFRNLCSIKVWGKISDSASNEQKEALHQILQQKNEQTAYDNSVEKSTNIVNSSVPCSLNSADLVVPEEFLDALTYELMALPMVNRYYSLIEIIILGV